MASSSARTKRRRISPLDGLSSCETHHPLRSAPLRSAIDYRSNPRRTAESPTELPAMGFARAQPILRTVTVRNVVAGDGYARAQPILRADRHCEGYGRPGGWVLVSWRVRHRASPIPSLGWAGDRLPIRYVACSPAICDPSSSIKRVGWVELLRNPSLVAISAAAIRNRLSEQSSKDRGVADRIAGDGFRKSSTRPTR